MVLPNCLQFVLIWMRFPLGLRRGHSLPENGGGNGRQRSFPAGELLLRSGEQILADFDADPVVQRDFPDALWLLAVRLQGDSPSFEIYYRYGGVVCFMLPYRRVDLGGATCSLSGVVLESCYHILEVSLMKKMQRIILLLLVGGMLFCGCSDKEQDPAPESSQDQSAEPDAEEKSEESITYDSAEKSVVDAMEPKRQQIRERALEVIPKERQELAGFQLRVEIYDVDLFWVTTVIDLGSGDVEEAKTAGADIIRSLLPLEQELEFTAGGYDVEVYNGEEIVGIVMTSDNPDELMIALEDGSEFFPLD